MANSKSAIKRNRQNEKRRVHNRYYRGRARTFIKRARAAIDEGNLETARERTIEAIGALDKAAAKGIIHENNAARRKSRLMRDLNTLAESKA
ncbi:MAG: 30S ribosomal protein S20 [Phycisphaerae bacterium]|nr:30S ribosomal protein S20 [Phycisphaerae bacterium]NIP56367.1 30S ribosomal protein S20 [Phycisphaerae bacterium]NIW44126.1 30S ribosomal protein S20 [Gammaproteobacteria bacterium]NIX32705.1 30S ribosomal protein S20 [Phycisphaerae bacterium]